MKNVMLKTSKLAEALQAEELNILDPLKNTRSTISVLKRFKASESEMNDQIKASCKFAEKIGIDPEEDFKKHHRKRRKPARADDNPNIQVDLTMPQHFRKEFKSVLDTFINMFEDMIAPTLDTLERFSRAGPRGRGREWPTLGVHPLSWLLSNNRLEKAPFVSVLHTSSNRLLLSNQDKGCTPSVAHSLPLPLGPALLNLWSASNGEGASTSFQRHDTK